MESVAKLKKDKTTNRYKVVRAANGRDYTIQDFGKSAKINEGAAVLCYVYSLLTAERIALALNKLHMEEIGHEPRAKKKGVCFA